MQLKPFVVSAPFGNWFGYPNATSTLGTYTLNYRGGRLYRLWRCLRTLRYSRSASGWVNKLGLPNPGIDSLEEITDQIVSIHGFDREEWIALAEKIRNKPIQTVEFNLSCPNVGHKHAINDVIPAISWLLSSGLHIITKLPPVRWMELAEPLHNIGVTTFHCCNTLPTPRGGLSGKSLKPLSLWAVSEIKQKWPDVKVIGGGGVTHQQDVDDYRNAGADHVAIGSVLFNPLNWRRVRRMIGEQEISTGK